MSSSGLQGGVAGFVQAVLVPHLAELLIKEDMDLQGDDWRSRAREVIAESAELGELANPELQEKVQADEDDEEGNKE